MSCQILSLITLSVCDHYSTHATKLILSSPHYDIQDVKLRSDTFASFHRFRDRDKRWFGSWDDHRSLAMSPSPSKVYLITNWRSRSRLILVCRIVAALNSFAVSLIRKKISSRNLLLPLLFFLGFDCRLEYTLVILTSVISLTKMASIDQSMP